MDGPYRLISELHAHSGPVRSLAQLTSTPGSLGTIATGCQADSPNVRRWTILETEIQEVGSALPHNHWVTALTFVPSGKITAVPQGALVTGCYDSIIRVFDSDIPLLTLTGHSKGIISFSWTRGHKLLSGSWDGTAKIWDLDIGGICLFTLAPHENGVHVLGLQSGLIVTTSTGEAVNGQPANFQIRFWDESTGKQVGDSVKDHSGSIRSVCSVPLLDGFATTSNDGTVAVRTSDGTRVESLVHPLQDDGIPPFILDCAALTSSEGLDLVSCGEDGSVVVWRDMSMLQSLPHPSCVWCVLALTIPGSEGDFITAGNDGVVRYFSRNPVLTSLPSSEQLTLQLISEVEEMRRKRHKGPSDEDLAKAAKWEQRGNYPGKSEGQVMLFNKSGGLIAAQWSVASQVWIEVGEVTGTGDSGDINGVTYDHVLPVEMETPHGLQNLQLGYNNGENPFVAAQRFIDANELGQGYLAQIADWISARAGKSAPTLDMNSSSGASRAAAPSASSHQPSQVNTPSLSSPFPQAVKGYVVFDDIPQGFASKVTSKIQEFNTAAGAEGKPQLSEADLTALEALLKVLQQTSYYHSSKVVSAHIKPLSTILHWNDVNKAFPALDILRIVATHPVGAQVVASSDALTAATAIAVKNASITPYESASAATLLTSVRFLANTFRHEQLRNAMASINIADILLSLSPHTAIKSKATRVAMSTLLLNYAVAISTKPDQYLNEKSSQEAFFSFSKRLLESESESSDVAYSVVLAAGTVLGSATLASGRITKDALSIVARDAGLPSAVTSAERLLTTGEAKSAVEALLKLL